MLLAFRDFAPRRKTPAGWFTVGTWEPFDTVLAEVNDWIAREGIDVINVETVVVPAHQVAPDVESSRDPSWTAGGPNQAYRQVIRVWYRLPTPLTSKSSADERIVAGHEGVRPAKDRGE